MNFTLKAKLGMLWRFVMLKLIEWVPRNVILIAILFRIVGLEQKTRVSGLRDAYQLPANWNDTIVKWLYIVSRFYRYYTKNQFESDLTRMGVPTSKPESNAEYMAEPTRTSPEFIVRSHRINVNVIRNWNIVEN